MLLYVRTYSTCTCTLHIYGIVLPVFDFMVLLVTTIWVFAFGFDVTVSCVTGYYRYWEIR